MTCYNEIYNSFGKISEILLTVHEIGEIPASRLQFFEHFSQRHLSEQSFMKIFSRFIYRDMSNYDTWRRIDDPVAETSLAQNFRVLVIFA